MTLKLKRTPGLYLVGFMGCGKSTIGRTLAEALGWSFVDIDSEIERKQGKTISQIFVQQGELSFRDLETEAIRSSVHYVQTGMPCVYALGGGAFVQPRNWELIENNGVTVWLDCPLEVIRQRLGDCSNRPLARNAAGLTQLYADRRPLYSRADYRVEITSDNVSETITAILGLPIF